jgi:hypothetical protein
MSHYLIAIMKIKGTTSASIRKTNSHFVRGWISLCFVVNLTKADKQILLWSLNHCSSFKVLSLPSALIGLFSASAEPQTTSSIRIKEVFTWGPNLPRVPHFCFQIIANTHEPNHTVLCFNFFYGTKQIIIKIKKSWILQIDLIGSVRAIAQDDEFYFRGPHPRAFVKTSSIDIKMQRSPLSLSGSQAGWDITPKMLFWMQRRINHFVCFILIIL